MVKLMRIFDLILNILFPPACVICNRSLPSNTELCDDCKTKFKREMFYQCPRCEMTADKCTCSEQYSELYKISKTEIAGKRSLSLTFYLSVGKRDEDRITERMLFELKEKNALFGFYAELLSSSIIRLFESGGENISEWILTYPPRSTEKQLDFGYDQCEEIVKRMSKILGIPWSSTLERIGGEEQKNLSEKDRFKNADAALILKKDSVKKGGKYILFDDILTTGATLSAAVRNLYFGGAAEVFPLTIAKTLYIK